METMNVSWQIALVSVLFIWHELEEYFVLLPWLEDNRNRLPYPLNKVNLSKSSFTFIAVEELILLILIGLLFSPVWFVAATIAYVLHLIVHCAQMIYTAIRHMPLGLWSAPIQLPICAFVLYSAPVNEEVTLGADSAIMIGVMVSNLVLMHMLTQKINKK